MQVLIRCTYQNLALGIAFKDWRTVYQLLPTPHPLFPEVYKGLLVYRAKGANKRLSYTAIKKELVKKPVIIVQEKSRWRCPF